MSARSKWLDWELRLKGSGIALAAAYASCYVLLRLVSVDQWYLPAGLRVAALLLFSYRYWPYLIAGEFLAFAYLRYPLVDKYGVVWAVAASVALMPVVAGIVYRHRKSLASHRIEWLLSVAALAALSVSAINIATSYFLMPASTHPMSVNRAIKFLIGDYLGILMVAPLALLWKQRHLAYPFPRKLRWDAAMSCAAIALLAACVEALPETEIGLKNFFRVLMIVPAIALTFLHGWRGAAIGIIGANLAIRLTMHLADAVAASDSDVFISQEILAISATTLLGLGAIISHYYHKARHHGLEKNQALDLARLSFLSSERELRERVARIRMVGDQLDETVQGLVLWLRERGHHAAAMDVMSTGVQRTRQFKDQLNLVYPAEIERYGLYGALDTEPLEQAWSQQDVEVIRRLHGAPRRLSQGLQLAAYRSIRDVIDLLSERGHRRILLRVRCGQRGPRCGVAIRLTALDAARPGSGASSFALDALEARVQAYGGLLHWRDSSVRLLLDEPAGSADRYGASAAGFATDQSAPVSAA